MSPRNDPRLGKGQRVIDSRTTSTYNNYAFYDDYYADSAPTTFEISSSPDPSVHDIPCQVQKKRKCRDVLCLCFFFATIVLNVGFAAYSFVHGDWRRFTLGVDLHCDLCGAKNGLKDGIPNSGKDLTLAPFLVTRRKNMKGDHFRFPDEVPLRDLKRETNAGKECRTECPSGSKIFINRCLLSRSRNKEVESNISARINIQALTLDDVADAVEDAVEFVDEIVEDLETSWKYILWISLISLIVAILVTILLRIFAGAVIWILVTIVCLAGIGGSVALWLLWWAESQRQPGKGSLTQPEVTALLVGAILVTIFTIILLAVLILMRQRISLVIQLFNEAGKAVRAVPLVLFQPVLTFVALGLALGSFLMVAILIETSGKPVVELGVNSTLGSCHYEKDWLMTVSRWWNLFVGIWMCQFVLGCQNLIIAGAISIWYFSRDKSRLGFPIALSYQRLLRYHLGSVAFGSLIIALVKLIRYIIHTVQQRFGGSNALCRAILWSFQCFTWCLEKFLKFLNGNAYIEIAIYGYGFCKSAQKALSVITQNALRIVTINTIGDFVLFLAKIGIVALSVFIGYEMIKNNGLNHVWVPLTVGGILAYFVAHCFISVYEMSIDTVFLCFCEDCETNDGLLKPYYMTKGLMEFVKNTERFLETRNESNCRKPQDEDSVP